MIRDVPSIYGKTYINMSKIFMKIRLENIFKEAIILGCLLYAVMEIDWDLLINF